jgi:hypothetical protein
MGMKKAFLPFVALAVAPPAVSALDWELPVFTVKYEMTDGAIENPVPDEDVFIPSSLRNFLEFHVRENADPLDLGLTVRYSVKDYLLQSGDYSYVTVSQSANLEATKFLDLGLTAGLKWSGSPQLDSSGQPKNYLALNGGITADIELFKGTGIDASLKAEYDMHEDQADSRQIYTAGLGVSSRLGQFLLGARYRGTFRLPLGDLSGVDMSMLHVASLSLQWNPNR